ncbi:hypothetical protein AAF712_008878 [Marasmius tenuissimus]|uniref:F-box domain-containing protein n=1 Tax=Marasmius tenuissimus TaxID=585030 RepID=A0ABR2ZSS1_9AGAR
MSTIPASFLKNSTHPPESLQKLFRHPVSNDDRAEITRYLVDTERSYDKCQLEINKYRALILILESERERMKKSMEKYRSLLSPVHRLPSELLLEIFGHLCKVNQLDDNTLAPASALSMVCGRWRQVALASPRLWSSISMYLYCSEGRRDKVIANLTRLFLERSRRAPLRLWIDFPWDPEEYHDGRTILDILEEQSERWEEVEVHGRELFASSQSRGDIHLPNLKHLALYTWTPDSPQSSWPLDRFKHCPVLTSFYTDVAQTEDRIELPWMNIRVLKLEYCTEMRALTVLTSFPNLEHLTISNIETYSADSEELKLVLDKLKTLTIDGERCSSTSILRQFTSRRLSSIAIANASIESLDLERFLQRSSCSITTLHLDRLVFTDSQLLSVLRFMPDLRTLDVGESKPRRVITSRFLDHLTVDPDVSRSPFLPHLTELRLKVSAKDLQERALVNALTSRWLPGGNSSTSTAMAVDRLESVDVVLLWWNDPPAMDTPSALQCLRAVGMRLTISHLTYGKE